MKKLIFVLVVAFFLIFGCTAPVDLNLGDSNNLVDNNTSPANGFSNLEDYRKVKNGDSVSVHYILTIDGEEMESSYNRAQPIQFVVGTGQMISGFDAAVVGMRKGDKKTVTLLPKDAYGEINEDNKQIILLSQLPDINFEVGQELILGQYRLKVYEVNDNNILASVNSANAGKTLTFDIELVKIN